MYRNCGEIDYVGRKYHISRVLLCKQNKKYDTPKNIGEQKKKAKWMLNMYQ